MVDNDPSLKEEDELEEMDMEQFPVLGDEEDFEEMTADSTTDLAGGWTVLTVVIRVVGPVC